MLFWIKIFSCSPSVLLILFRLHADINNLQDVVVGAELQSADINLDVVLQEVLSKLPNFLWPGRTPHQSLSVRLRDREKACRWFQREKYSCINKWRWISIHGDWAFVLPWFVPLSFESVAQSPCPACGQPRLALGRYIVSGLFSQTPRSQSGDQAWRCRSQHLQSHKINSKKTHVLLYAQTEHGTNVYLRTCVCVCSGYSCVFTWIT